jgi:hypothetical protein
MPLPITLEAHRRAAPHGEGGNDLGLPTIRNAAVIFAPVELLCVAEQAGSGVRLEDI